MRSRRDRSTPPLVLGLSEEWRNAKTGRAAARPLRRARGGCRDGGLPGVAGGPPLCRPDARAEFRRRDALGRRRGQMAKPIVLITGAGIGIGRATANAFASAGYHVVVTDILDKEGSRGRRRHQGGRRRRRVPGTSTSPTRRGQRGGRRCRDAPRRASTSSSPMPASPTRCRSRRSPTRSGTTPSTST